MKGLTAALTPPLPNEKRTTLTPNPAAAVPSRASAAGMDVNKRIKAPRKTMLEQCQSSVYGSPVSSRDLHGRKENRFEATKPPICDHCPYYRCKVGKGHEAGHDQRRGGLLQAQCSGNLVVATMLKIVLCISSVRETKD